MNNRINNVEEWISDLEDRVMKNHPIRTADRKPNEKINK